MTEEIRYEQFEQDPAGASSAVASASEIDLRRVSEVPMELSVEIGRTHMTVGETLDLRVGSVVMLDRLAGEPVDLLVNGTPIGRGEVVVVDDKFGLRLKEVLDASETAGADEPVAVEPGGPMGATGFGEPAGAGARSDSGEPQAGALAG